MYVPRVYLETSVINMYFDDHAAERQNCTKILFEEIKQGKYVPFVSDYVIQEIEQAEKTKCAKMLHLLAELSAVVLERSDSDIKLALEYVAQGVIPEKYVTDGLHIAIASVHALDVIFSYNFKHIVKSKTKVMTEIINREHGYNSVVIMSPEEVIDL